MEIQIFTVGGTIDKIYFDAKSEFKIGEPQIGELLQEANVNFSWRLDSLLRNTYYPRQLEIDREDSTRDGLWVRRARHL